MAGLELLQPTSAQLFGFYPEKILNGELWRMVTGQLLHTNITHLLLNCGGFLLIWALHGEYYGKRQFSILLLSSLLLVGISLMLFAEYRHYAGMSAIIHTFIIYGAIQDILNKDKTGWLIVLGVFLKVVYENVYGASESTIEMINANVAVEAHLLGVLAGLVLAALLPNKTIKKGQS